MPPGLFPQVVGQATRAVLHAAGLAAATADRAQRLVDRDHHIGDGGFSRGTREPVAAAGAAMRGDNPAPPQAGEDLLQISLGNLLAIGDFGHGHGAIAA